ncbi:protein NLP7-like [Solanum tuberosum]|nr:PREDICTED: protein NLP7-like [Solanum tuberosum]
MEYHLRQVLEICGLMSSQLEWCEVKCNASAFWSIKQEDELEYQRTISPFISAPASLDFSFLMLKLRIKSVIEKMSSPHICLVQFWAPIKVNGSTFLSTADQICAFNKSLSSYRRLCIDTLIPIDDYMEGLLGPLGRVFRRCLPEYNPDVQSYSAAEFPLLETAISLGIHSYYAFPVFNLHDQRYLGVFNWKGKWKRGLRYHLKGFQ